MQLGYCSIESRSLSRRAKKKLFPNQGAFTKFMRKENSGNECDIKNNIHVNVEKDAESEK